MSTSGFSLWDKEICPYCFEPFRLRGTPFRCSSPQAVCPPETDPVREEKWGDGAALGRVLEPGGFFSREQTCPECAQASRQRICPACHMDLPHTTGQFESLIFAVIGAKESGKSHYIAVLIDQLRKQYGPRMGMLLEELDDETIKRYRKDFHRPLFEKRHTLDATRSALAERQVALPLVYSLTFREKGLFGRQRIRSVVNLVFFDTAGEDLDDEDVMGTVNKYIYRSDGLILLLDPLQLSKVRQRLTSGTRLPEVNTETRDILNRVTRLVRKGRNLSPKQQIDTPLAIAFSKFDAVQSVAHGEMQVFHQADHDRGFDRQDFEAVHGEMASLLSQWDSEELVNQASTNYRVHGLFGLSALGMDPGESQKVPHILPRRVADPFLWLLYRHGLLPASDGSHAIPWWRRAWQRPAVRWAALVAVLILLLWGGYHWGGFAFLLPAPSGPSPSPPTVAPSTAVSGPAPVRLVGDIELRNEMRDGRPLGTPSTTFPRDDLRFLAFHVEIAADDGPVEGQLRARYLDPRNRLMTPSGADPDRGHSVAWSTTVDESLRVSQGYGAWDRSVFAPGPHRLELWWDDHPLGTVSFQVEAD